LQAPLVSSPYSSNLRSARSPWPRPRPHKSWPLPTRPTPTQTPSRPLYQFPHSQKPPSLPSLMHCLFPELGRPSLLRPHCAFYLGEFRLGVCNSRHASICPLPLWFPLPEHRRRRPRRSSCPYRCSRVPESPLEVCNPAPPLFSPGLPLVVRNCSSE
jgi:hypothetical protein